jgi:thiol-disulfide isomerase/thioredoxin
VEELDQILKTATRPVMLDFYADWCISCKEMERFTFADPAVARGSRLPAVQADVTANNDADKALLKRFKLFGPPGIIFFDAAGAERKACGWSASRTEAFGKVLDAALQPAKNHRTDNPTSIEERCKTAGCKARRPRLDVSAAGPPRTSNRAHPSMLCLQTRAGHGETR